MSIHECVGLFCAGVSVRNNYDVNSLAVPRKAKEAIGGLALLKHQESGHQVLCEGCFRTGP